MPKTIEVEMDDCNFTSKKNTDLVTFGVSTCIAFIIYASFFDEDDNWIQSHGLYHWPGFKVGQKDPTKSINDTFSYFLDEFRMHFDLPFELEIQIDSLLFIGGEKAVWENDELILSGTEREVYYLTEAVRDYDYAEAHFSKPKHINHSHFLTSGNESLTIKVSSTQCNYITETFNDCCEEKKENHSSSLK